MDIPVLGVCLGHQGLALAFHGSVEEAKQGMHGRKSQIYHDQNGIFKGIPSPFSVVRYHSLIVNHVPNSLIVNATTMDGIVMGIQHKELPYYGV